MSTNIAQKWDEKYASASLQTPAKPCFVLKQHSHLLPFNGKALELACGLGGNARFLAQCGLKVQAWDISDNALTVLNNWASINQLPIEPLITDLEQMLLPYQQYDVIVISRYLDRNLFSQLVSALKPNGLLIYQTFLAPVQDSAPRNPEFYIESGELNQAWSELETLVYGEGWLNHENSGSDDTNKHRYAWYIGKKPK
ncbi:MAG: class I SAM-dependent methyltransferase [Pseudomonadota bacterium]|nr:class I SAM-dependent methyltransferase [Pseudomonadota bacterium]